MKNKRHKHYNISAFHRLLLVHDKTGIYLVLMITFIQYKHITAIIFILQIINIILF